MLNLQKNEEFEFGLLTTLTCSGERDASHSVKLGNWVVTTEQYGDWNNDKYSRSYHRQYGGVFEIDGRTIEFKRPHGKGFIVKHVQLYSWAGDFVARAVIEAGLAPKKPKYSLKIRLNKAYDAKKVCAKRGYVVYSRTLLGGHVDYVIERNGVVFHAVNSSELFKGLHNKIRKQGLKLKGKLIGFDDCKKLGFCDVGIREFCENLGLDIKKLYAPFEIRALLKNNGHGVADTFSYEISQMSKAIGYNLLS